MSAFTKGPWKAETELDYAINSHELGPIAIVNCVESDFGFYRDADDGGKAEGHANAHLIAASPDMYEALENLLIHLSMGWEIDECMESGKAALAKARGE